jgi:hypothetical protein
VRLILFPLATLLCCAADTSAPAGIFRGALLESRGSDGKGDFYLRAADNTVYWCSYDERTYVERDGAPSAVASLSKGEAIEVVTDRGPAPSRCYARIITARAVPEVPVSRVRSALRPRPRPLLEPVFPRGNLMFAGVVLVVDPEWVTVQTRRDGRKTFLLRADTRYSADGAAADLAALRVNSRVFIRAGKNIDDDLEAYQVVWGRFVMPPANQR